MKKLIALGLIVLVLIVAARSSKAECYPAKVIAKGNLTFFVHETIYDTRTEGGMIGSYNTVDVYDGDTNMMIENYWFDACMSADEWYEFIIECLEDQYTIDLINTEFSVADWEQSWD